MKLRFVNNIIKSTWRGIHYFFKDHHAMFVRNAAGGWIVAIQLSEILMIQKERKKDLIKISYGEESYILNKFNAIHDQNNKNIAFCGDRDIFLYENDSRYLLDIDQEYLIVSDIANSVVTKAKFQKCRDGVSIKFSRLVDKPILIACVLITLLEVDPISKELNLISK